jgi:NAD(P)-dependent dehydrogenase (short-subunit alcohol dehydrogenase family)
MSEPTGRLAGRVAVITGGGLGIGRGVVRRFAAEGARVHRIGDPDQDIAPMALFLASEDCRYLTGNTLFADGGSHINGVSWQPDLDAG